MNIIVCLKQVVDPETPVEYFEIDPETNRPDDELDMVIDTYAENALETAIQLRDQFESATVTALCLGDEESEEILRRAMAFTADNAIRVWDEDWEDMDLDGQVVGYILGKAIESIGGADIILTGYQASDIEEGLVGTVIAEELNIPCVTLVSDVGVEGDSVRVTSEAEDGYNVFDISSSTVLTVISSEKNIPRLPKVKDVRLARKKPIKELELDDINEDRYNPAVTLEKVFVPDRSVSSEILPGEDETQLAEDLVEKLLDLKVL